LTMLAAKPQVPSARTSEPSLRWLRSEVTQQLRMSGESVAETLGGRVQD
jgi:hypothetical protein